MGALPCELALEAILREPANQRFARPVRRFWGQITNTLKKLKHHLRVQDVEFYDFLLHTLFANFDNRITEMRTRMPAVVCNHVRCCLCARFRIAWDEIKRDIKQNLRLKSKGLPPLPSFNEDIEDGP